MSIAQRRSLIEADHEDRSIARQCELVSISRSSFYYQPTGETAENLALMRLIDAQFLETPWYGSRQMAAHLRRDGREIGRKRVRRLMATMGLAASVRVRRYRIRSIGFIPICCGIWWSIGPTRSGARTSRIFRCGGAFCIWSR